MMLHIFRTGYSELHLRTEQQGNVVSQDTRRQMIKLIDPAGAEREVQATTN